jgi:protease I
MVIAQKNFRDEELLIPKEILENAGHKVKIASLNRGSATGMLGAKVEAEFGVHEVNSDFFDAIVIVGGSGSPTLLESNDVIKLVRESAEKGKVIGAICLGPMVLAKAGVLVDKQATVFKTKEAIDLLKKNGAVYKEQPLVVDGKIITANGPAVADIFGKKIAEMLKK